MSFILVVRYESFPHRKLTLELLTHLKNPTPPLPFVHLPCFRLRALTTHAHLNLLPTSTLFPADFTRHFYFDIF